MTEEEVIKIEGIVSTLRESKKPRHVRVQPQQFDRFCRANIAYGGIWASQHQQVKEESFDTVLIEMTPEMQLLLKYVYQK